MDSPSPDMWANVRKLYDSGKEKALASLQERLKGTAFINGRLT
jgi:hypothetical protein